MNYICGSKKLVTAAGAAVALFSLTAGAHAEMLIIGTTDSTGGNAFPFGTGAGLGGQSQYVGEYQQDYSSTFFSGPITIDSISFASDPADLGRLGTYSDTFTVSLGSTTTDPTALNSTFADNITSPLTQVFSGTVTADLEGSGNPDFYIPITTFTYTPSPGSNLLLDVNISSSTGPGAQYFDSDEVTPGIGRVINVGGANISDDSGLVTYFNFPESTPEPSPLGALAVGLAMVTGLLVYRKKRKA